MSNFIEYTASAYDPVKSTEAFPKITTEDVKKLLDTDDMFTPKWQRQFYQNMMSPITSNSVTAAPVYNTPTTVVTKNMSFQDLITSQNLPIKVTSDYRAGARTNSGNVSNHSKKDAQGNPMAYDIQPQFNGKVDKSPEAFQRLYSTMASNPIVKQWFKERGFGILDETTPKAMKKYGSTGPHFHIGPDKAAIKFDKKGAKLPFFKIKILKDENI